MINHSWNLLNAEEQLILCRLAVFRGSFSREAAEKVCGASLHVLSSLRNKSLLRITDRRLYNLHELIHQYAALKLAENPAEEYRLRNSHAIYFAGRLADWEIMLKSSRQVETLNESGSRDRRFAPGLATDGNL
jgi:predicted ATPase